MVAHPLFAVCPEWPVIVSGRESGDRWGITPSETQRGIHATHDVTIHRLIRPGDVLTTTARCTGVERRRPGAFATTVLTTVDADGEPVASTEQGALYLGVPVDGDDRRATPVGAPLDLPERGHPVIEVPVSIAHGAAHVYTDCARIWNPIHTDAAVAETAGLPGIILHGTATLATGVSKVIDECAEGDPARVRRIIGRFGAMVMMPSTITVRIYESTSLTSGETAVPFDVRTEDGGLAVDRGVVVIE